jgi:hypothetical protein
VTARLKFPLILFATLAVGSSLPASSRMAAAAGIDPASMPAVLSDAADAAPEAMVIDARIVLDPEAGGSLSGEVESILADGAIVTETGSPIVESVVESAGEPRVLDVSSQAFDGVLMDDFNVDEMPYEASSGRWFWNGGWYVGGESLWMERSRDIRTPIATDTVLIPYRLGFRFSQYTTNAQPFNIAPGARVTLGKSLGRDYLDRDRAVEFIYYGGMTYNSNVGFNALGRDGFVTPLGYDVAGFNGANTFNTKYNSDFNSWEWNYKLRRRLGRDQMVMSPGGNWTRHAERGWLPALITGIRLANVNEDFRLQSSLRPGSFPGQQPLAGDYVINTSNWLLGLNIGGELISQNEFYYWGLRGRAAPSLVFANMSQEAAGYNSNANYPTRPGLNSTGTAIVPVPFAQTPFSFADQDSQTTAGFIGDLTLLAGWQIKPNFSLQVGYDFLWVAGMASAIKQFNLDQRSSGRINTGGQTFYNGFSFGFNGSW